MEIVIPSNFTATVGTNSTTLIANLSGVVSLLLGILLAFWIASIVINILRQKKEDDTIE